jgi:hypothetical protein
MITTQRKQEAEEKREKVPWFVIFTRHPLNKCIPPEIDIVPLNFGLRRDRSLNGGTSRLGDFSPH